MGYYATGSGSIELKKNVDLEKVKAAMEEIDYSFSCNIFSGVDSFVLDIQQYEKYYEEDYNDFLKAVTPYVKDGCIEFCGEDGCLWRFVFIDGKFIEENAEIVWPSEKKESPSNEPHTRGYMLCSIFGRELFTEQFKTLQGAREKMFEELQKELRFMCYDTNRYNWSLEEYDNGDDDYPMGWHQYGAYFHNSNGEYDWYIVPVE